MMFHSFYRVKLDLHILYKGQRSSRGDCPSTITSDQYGNGGLNKKSQWMLRLFEIVVIFRQ